MALRRPFVPPRSTRTQRHGRQSQQDKSELSPMKTSICNKEEGYNQTPISECRVSDNVEDLLPLSEFLLEDKEQGLSKDKSKRGKRREKRQQGVSDDEEDSVPISQLIVKDKLITDREDDEEDSVPISQLLVKDKAAKASTQKKGKKNGLCGLKMWPILGESILCLGNPWLGNYHLIFTFFKSKCLICAFDNS